MPKQKLKNNLRSRFIAGLMVAALLVATAATNGFGVFAATCSTVSQCQEQINQLNDANNQAAAKLGSLENQASSYQDALSRLQSQIDGLQQQIVANQNQEDAVKQKIADAQVELNHEKKTLGENIKQMYLQGNMSTIEILASSNNLSTYVNRQEYRNAVQQQVKDTLDKITQLKLELQQQQQKIETLLKVQQNQRNQLAADQEQQTQLLSYNESQQAAFNQKIQANKSQINQLRAQIVALNTPVGSSFTYSGSCGGGYPATAGPGLWGGTWGCNYYKDNTIDNWGMFNRECVSYTAWMVHEEYVNGQVAHDMPNWGGVGNAYQWIPDAENAGIPVDQSPKAGDIAIRPASGINGDVGHAMYVQAVSGGQIYVKQYNADLQGNYSEGWRSTYGLYFLHFSDWK